VSPDAGSGPGPDAGTGSETPERGPVARVAALPGRLRALWADLARDGRGRILAAVAAGWFLGIGMRISVPALLPRVRTGFDLGLTTAGLLLTALWVGYALFQFPGGLLGDRVGERVVLAASTALAILGLAACAAAPTPAALFGGVVLLGIATGLYATTRFTVLADVYPDRAATAIGISSSAGNVGTVLLPVAVGGAAAAFGWRAGFGAAIPLFAAATVGLWLAVPGRTSPAGADGTGSRGTGDPGAGNGSEATARRVLAAVTEPRVLALSAAMFLMSFVYQGFTGFYPTYLTEVKGLPGSTATLLYGGFFAAGIVVQPVGGAVADAIGERTTVVALTGLTAVGLAAAPGLGGVRTLAAVSVLLGAQLGFWPIALAATTAALPDDIQGTGFGLIRSAYLAMAAAAPTVVGSLAEGGGFGGAFLLLAGCAALAGLFGLSLSSPGGDAGRTAD